MAMTINGTNGVTFNDGTSMATGQQACKAWVNFNGTGTVAIRAAFNVSSITDNGTGDYKINFTNPMPDVNFCGCGIAKDQNYIDMQIPSPSSSYAIVRHRLDNSALTDGQVNFAVFR